MKKKRNTEEVNPEKSRYVARRFVPVLVTMVAVNMSSIFLAPTRIHWVAAITGGLMAIYLFRVKIAAEKKFPR